MMDLHAFLYLLLGIILPGMAYGLQITSTGPRSILKASGDSVTLDCDFTLAPEDSGHLDIEWTLMASDSQNLDKVILLYSGGRVYEDYYPATKGRMHFSSALPKDGDASVNLTRLEVSDTGTYQCKVKKAPGIGSRKIFLSVMVRPSKPHCFKEGLSREGEDLVLRCASSEGTHPLQYTWEKTSDGTLPPTSTVLDPVSGVMTIKNVSAGASGTYRCTAKNRVGADECVLHLRITPSRNMAGVIAGAVIGVLLSLILTAIVLFCCCRARNRKYEKETAYEIREDVPPPRSRVSVARSVTSAGSHRSSLGSLSPSNLHEYAPKPQYDKVSTEERERPPGHAPAAGATGPNPSLAEAVPVATPAQRRDGSIV
ncbi:coxsackievirus and adenovirus receptor homolog [Anguilla anguilla]|uniref:coxsackievirus and adenovirus receptor homolog n=1 Tax=Anguilla anguilla TaxID=7936 RepID=UPI0015ABCA81|nr:coxsackievirus and adenovirus receptor homolog [Anguilla anguilla]